MSGGVYGVTVMRDFVAQHALIGGDWGPENTRHSHHYKLELTLEGTSLDQHNYLVDIVAIEARLDEFVATYADTMLNDAPAFADQNPSIELFARVAWEFLVPALAASTVDSARVQLWEHDTAWASYAAPVRA